MQYGLHCLINDLDHAMYWEEDKTTEQKHVLDDVVDMVFAIQCKCLPVDHVHALSESVQKILPWLVNEPVAGVHSIHVAASGNGWMRPEDPNELLHLSRRTKLELRVPKHRIDDARQLEGVTLNVKGYAIEVKESTIRPMSEITTLFARYLATADNLGNEEEVLEWVVEQLGMLEIKPRKMLCGTQHDIDTPEGKIRTRSLMLADLEVEESIRLQEKGLGPFRNLGCGLFIPHKDINDLQSGKK
jgi:CRISPR-associated protein Cas6